MKTTEFKVHTIYSKDDILQMEKISTGRTRLIVLAVLAGVTILYGALLIWVSTAGGLKTVLEFLRTMKVMDAIYLIILAVCLAVIIGMPYYRRRKILKDVPGGVMKANYYFYEKTFQYGWGNSFRSTAYVEISKFKNLAESFYIEANGLTYLVKKSDFQVGTPEEFLSFMEKKLICKIS